MEFSSFARQYRKPRDGPASLLPLLESQELESINTINTIF